MTPEKLAQLIFEALLTIAEADSFDFSSASVDDIDIERPKNRDHGDWSTNIALKRAKQWGINPRELAEKIASSLEQLDVFSQVDIAGPGFINFTVAPSAAALVVPQIIEEGSRFGAGYALQGLKYNIEFVSANPTGPIHLGGTRWAAVGDSLSRIIQFQGAEVTKEYYFNDHGAQIDRFSRSLVASYKGESAPEDGYGGQYISEIAAKVVETFGPSINQLPAEELQETFRSIGVELMFAEINQSLANFGVNFDVYFHEDSLHSSGAVNRAIARLKELGHIYESEGAIWLSSTEFGDDKDRVIIKQDGMPAYIAADLAYYLDKRQRGFDRNIIMLGADHHGYVKRMMAMCSAFGDEPGVHLEIMIGQLVNLLQDGSPMKMSKRAGTIVTMEDFVDVVGVDAARYSLVRSSTDSQLDIDLDLLSKKTNDNPVHYVQYAHARTCAVARNAATVGISRDLGFEPESLNNPAETELFGFLQEFPRIVALAAEQRTPHRIPRYLEELAGYYHRWYDKCRIVPPADEPIGLVNHSRLWVNDAVGQTLRNGLELIGVSAPERM